MSKIKRIKKNNLNKRCVILSILCISLFLMSCAEEMEDELQWAINNYGQEINDKRGIEDIDIKLPDNSSLELSGENNIICIVDSAINHSNKLLDGLFVNDVSKLSEHNETSHGMQIAGIICSNESTNEYISVLKNACFYYIEVNKEDLDVKRLISELEKAEDAGARVVNCSFVMKEYDEQLFDYIKSSKMLYVCAVGNNYKNEILYPAAYELDNIISVIGVNNCGFCSRYSNYSEKADIGAPGEDILCISNIEGKYEYMSGSSLATAYVTSACAYIYNAKNCSAAEIKDILLSNCVNLSTLDGKVSKGHFLCFKNIIEDLK